ncbi:MAG: serine hydrolase domain-containing protein [bacterium]|nr:serine hydrolase domain-containing protein [bacterium]
MKHFLQGLIVMVMLSVLVVVSPAQAQSTDITELTDDIDAYVAEMMELYDVPGVGLAIVDDGEIAYTAGYGVRSVETNEPVTPETVFSIGSVTKSFTALAIAQQVDAGTLDLDTPIVEYVPDLAYTDPRFEQITLRHLLSHTSGLPVDDIVWASGLIETRDALVEDLAMRELVTDPGTTFAYNNGGYALAGYVLEQVTGQSWEEYIETSIFAPLEMTTAVVTPEDYEAIDNHAVPHVLDIREGNQPVELLQGMALVAPAGAVFASAEEMAHYAILQLGDGTYNGEQVVSPELLDEMHTPIKDGYGLGWIERSYEDVEIVWHNGASDGFYSGLSLVPAEDLGIVILTNDDVFNGAAEFELATNLGILDLLLNLDPEQSPVDFVSEQSGTTPQEVEARLEAARTYEADPTIYEPLVGEYTSPLGEMRLEVRGDALYVVANQEGYRYEAELIPFAENQFLGNMRGLNNSVLRFEIDEQGTVILYQDDSEIGRKLGEGVEVSTYEDPDGRYTVSLPDGFALETQENLIVLTSADQEGAYYLGTGETRDDQAASAAAFAQRFQPDFTGEAVDVRAIPLPSGIEWTQYIYVLPDGETLLAVLIATAGDTDYFIAVEGDQAQLQALTPGLNTMLLSFTING